MSAVFTPFGYRYSCHGVPPAAGRQPNGIDWGKLLEVAPITHACMNSSRLKLETSLQYRNQVLCTSGWSQSQPDLALLRWIVDLQKSA